MAWHIYNPFCLKHQKNLFVDHYWDWKLRGEKCYSVKVSIIWEMITSEALTIEGVRLFGCLI